MTNKPFFSIIVPTRDRGQELQICLDAIFQQSFSDYQVLILDDGSDDDVRQQHQQRLKQYDTRFQWFEVNGAGSLGSGPSVVRNIGLEKATGNYVTFCDDDDCWHRDDHLEVAAEALKKTNAQAYFSGMQIKDDQGKIVIDQQMTLVSEIALQQQSIGIEGVYPLSASQILLYPDYAHLNITIVDRVLLEQLGGFWPHTRFAEDVDLFVRICDKAKGILFRPEICATHFAPEKRQTVSVSNRLSMQDKRLLEISVYQHLLVHCEGIAALNYARKSLAITEKMLTEELKLEKKKIATNVFSGNALSALFSLKWAVYTLWLRLDYRE
ncbi:MAG: glycosyltransferase [Methylomarinum sp.]|nr:glycosyltransferase [Methylomarinum sp.]